MAQSMDVPLPQKGLTCAHVRTTRCCPQKALVQLRGWQGKDRTSRLNRKGCAREARLGPPWKAGGPAHGHAGQRDVETRAGADGTHLSSRFCPTHTRPPWRGVGLLHDRCRTWKPMPQVVLQGDQEVQGVQPPFLGRQSSGDAESDDGSESVPSMCPPTPTQGPPDWGPWDPMCSVLGTSTPARFFCLRHLILESK